MADERTANEKFNTNKRSVIRALGSQVTDNVQIDNFCKPLFKATWGGCFGEAEFKLNNQKNKSYILNTSKKGTHWVAVIVGGGKSVYVFDSFDRPTGRILRHLKKECTSKSYRIVESKRDRPEQNNDSALCGQISIAWLLTAKELGIRHACLI